VGHHPNLKTLSLAAALAGLLAPAGRAETVRITLADALAMAERQSPDLAAARAQAQAADLRAEVARRAGWPRLDLSVGGSYTDLPSAVFAHKLDAGELKAGDFQISRLNDPAGIFHLGTTLAVEAPIDAFGKVQAGARQASAGAKSAGAQMDEGRLDLRMQVATAYQQVALARGALAATERALAGAKARESDVEARVEGGAALQAELLRARARRREREADLAERRADLRTASAALARALGGATPGTVYEPADDPAAPSSMTGDLDSWTARALRSRPLLAAMAARTDAARWALRGEERSRLPDLAVWGQLQGDGVESGGKAAGGAGVSLRWSAFDPGRDSRRAALEAEAQAAEARNRAAADQIRLEVETAWDRAVAARERHAATAGGAEEGREALRVVRERRQAGIATLTDELETEAASLAAELQELRAAAEAAIADAALERAAGGEKP
jgi:outer membrane protein TolC